MYLFAHLARRDRSVDGLDENSIRTILGDGFTLKKNWSGLYLVSSDVGNFGMKENADRIRSLQRNIRELAESTGYDVSIALDIARPIIPRGRYNHDNASYEAERAALDRGLFEGSISQENYRGRIRELNEKYGKPVPTKLSSRYAAS